MNPETIEILRAKFGGKLPFSECAYNILADSTDALEHIQKQLAEKNVLPLSAAQEMQFRLCFICRAMNVAQQIATVARAGIDVSEIAESTGQQLATFLEDVINNP